MEREEMFIKKQEDNGECARCYKETHGAIQMCEIEGHCKYDEEAIREWERILDLI